jgi:hypothetical protein
LVSSNSSVIVSCPQTPLMSFSYQE